MEVDKLQKKKLISLLICIMMCVTIFVSFVSLGSASSSVFGQTVKGGSRAWQPAGEMVASRFTASSGGVPSSISVYVSNPSGSSDTAKCCYLCGVK